MGNSRRGVPNKVTSEIRGKTADLLVENFPRLIIEMSALEGKEYVDAYVKLAKIVLPTLQSIDMNATVEKDEGLEGMLGALIASQKGGGA